MHSTSLNDHDLMLRIAGGDARAFDALYSRHNAEVFRLALRVTGRRRAAEEITQDAFVGLWRRALQYDQSRGNFRSWILAAARNRSIDWLRREGRHDNTVDIDEPAASGLQSADCTEHEAVQHEEANTTRRLVADLPVAQREVIELGFFGQLTQTEIAHATGVPLGTVKGRQRLALTRLHKQLHQLEHPADATHPKMAGAGFEPAKA
jgi:RNA polymerase sigma-70 factor, ECF subfamily